MVVNAAKVLKIGRMREEREKTEGSAEEERRGEKIGMVLINKLQLLMVLWKAVASTLGSMSSLKKQKTDLLKKMGVPTASSGPSSTKSRMEGILLFYF